MKEKIVNLLFEQAKETGNELLNDELLNPTLNTKLYGSKGNLDSMNLVIFISEIESKASELFGKDIVIVNEKAMSQRSSPFHTIQTLADYIEKILNEEQPA
jgi:acyl carrier protein